MLWLVGLGIGAIALFALGNRKEGANLKTWNILLQVPAALSQANVPELISALGMSRVVTAYITAPQPGYNVLTIKTDSQPPPTGMVVTVAGVPLTVYSVQQAPVA